MSYVGAYLILVWNDDYFFPFGPSAVLAIDAIICDICVFYVSGMYNNWVLVQLPMQLQSRGSNLSRKSSHVCRGVNSCQPCLMSSLHQSAVTDGATQSYLNQASLMDRCSSAGISCINSTKGDNHSQFQSHQSFVIPDTEFIVPENE